MLTNESLDLAFRAIGEPRRREILRLLAKAEMGSGDIAAQFDVTGPAISQHLGILAEAGLVRVRRQGTKRIYRSSQERVDQVRAYLADFWATGLERLKSEAEQEERRQHGGSTN